MKLNILFIGIFLSLFLFSCYKYSNTHAKHSNLDQYTWYNFNFRNENIPYDQLSVEIFPYENPKLYVIINNQYFGSQLKNIEYINGWVKIGDMILNFENDEINISLVTKELYAETPSAIKLSKYQKIELVQGEIIINDKIIASEEDKLEILQHTSKIYIYKHINEEILDSIIEQNSKNVQLYFQYNLFFDNEIIEVLYRRRFSIGK